MRFVQEYGKNFYYRTNPIKMMMMMSVMVMMMMMVFVVWLTNERRLALFPAGTNVRDPDHLESPTHC